MKEEQKVPEIIGKETSRRGFLKGAAVTAGGAIALATIGGVKPQEAKAAEAPKVVQRYLFVERQNCTGCRACEYACNVKHEGVVRPAAARVHVYKHKGVIDVPVICWHCDDHPCVAACPTNPKSLIVDPKSNGITVNEKTCLGEKCMKCAEACPAQYVRVHPDSGNPIMCDMCGGDPECVKACLQQSGKPQGPCLIANTLGFGVNLAYRNVTPVQAAEDMMDLLFYPSKGDRPKTGKSGKGR
jgi:Fe-S-cluster-containing hydrogenase component 2